MSELAYSLLLYLEHANSIPFTYARFLRSEIGGRGKKKPKDGTSIIAVFRIVERKQAKSLSSCLQRNFKLLIHHTIKHWILMRIAEVDESKTILTRIESVLLSINRRTSMTRIPCK